ncbi:N-acetylglucosamine-1-phosphodiester alpha-N-acetylglucosaminidase-like [Haliotis asinina]|uniref:N-acetylglucosamine-1-phosphodiester alpha-N-acetylglucosaminidase-like n=1 Tax=Haliotis asinina TaxID=109174 RepID=UPI0035323B4C
MSGKFESLSQEELSSRHGHSYAARDQNFITDGLNELLPYLIPAGSTEEVENCKPIKFGNLTHSKHKARNSTNMTLPLVESRHQLKRIGRYRSDERVVAVLFQKVNNPLKTFSVLEPAHPGTCVKGSSQRATVRESSKQKHCVLATNAGFFDVDTGECFGNVYSDGRLVSDSGGVRNAHFGITVDGYIFTGYLSEQDLSSHRFTQLVGGVVWLLKDGEIYVDESIKTECSNTSKTKTLKEFSSIQKSRIAVGHDKDGRILVAHVDVARGNIGVDLHELASILLDLGFVNAINLDSGGSTTTVINGTLASHPSDQCTDKIFNCEREVSTILCIHEPESYPPNS